jgi:hypothetical protein
VKVTSVVGFALAAFLLAAGGIFYFTSHEATGGLLLTIAAVGSAYVGLVARSAARRAEGGEPAEPVDEQGEAEETINPTIWPLVISLAALGIVLGVVLAKWLLILGILLFLLSGVGWFNDIRRQHSATEHHSSDR